MRVVESEEHCSSSKAPQLLYVLVRYSTAQHTKLCIIHHVNDARLPKFTMRGTINKAEFDNAINDHYDNCQCTK